MAEQARLTDTGGHRHAPACDRFAFTGEAEAPASIGEEAFVEGLRERLESEADHLSQTEVTARGPGWAEVRGRLGRDMMTIIVFDLPIARFAEYRAHIKFDLSRRPVPLEVTGHIHPTFAYALSLAIAFVAVFVYVVGVFIAAGLVASFGAERSSAERHLRKALNGGLMPEDAKRKAWREAQAREKALGAVAEGFHRR